MEQRIAKKTGLHIIPPGLSVREAGMKGPVVEDELSKARDFGTRIANHLRNNASSFFRSQIRFYEARSRCDITMHCSMISLVAVYPYGYVFPLSRYAHLDNVISYTIT